MSLNQRSTGSWGVRDRKQRSDRGEKRLAAFTSGPPSVKGGSVRMAELAESEKETAKLLDETNRIKRAETQRQADPNTGKLKVEDDGEEDKQEEASDGGTTPSVQQSIHFHSPTLEFWRRNFQRSCRTRTANFHSCLSHTGSIMVVLIPFSIPFSDHVTYTQCPRQ